MNNKSSKNTRTPTQKIYSGGIKRMYNIQYIQVSDRGQGKNDLQLIFFAAFGTSSLCGPLVKYRTPSVLVSGQKRRVYIGVCVREDDSHRLSKYVI